MAIAGELYATGITGPHIEKVAPAAKEKGAKD
jgi:hypothetical protein